VDEVKMKNFLNALIFCLVCCCFPVGAQDANQYPQKTVKMVAPGPGSGTDLTARVLAKQLAKSWKQAVIIENKPGAGGSIGIAAVINAAPDGYTLLANSATYVINPALYKKLPYDAAKGLVDLSLMTTTPYVLVVSEEGPYKSLKDLVGALKAGSGNITFGSAGVGSSTHLASEYFNQFAGVKALHIPYKSSPEAIQDVMAGRITYFMAPFDTAVTYIKSKKLRPLGITSKDRLPSFNELNTIAEQGYPNFNINFWVGLWAPTGTPPEILRKINRDVSMALQDPEIKVAFEMNGVEVKSLTQPEFKQFIQDELQKYRKIVSQAGIMAE
jgi:tripartite-type tricarboxylate transporter receptor subunit TctC